MKARYIQDYIIYCTYPNRNMFIGRLYSVIVFDQIIRPINVIISYDKWTLAPQSDIQL